MFLVLEGLDGAGKSTQIKYLQSFLQTKNREYRMVHFPRFDAPLYGPLIAQFLRGDLGAVDQVSPYLVALLYAGDRHHAALQIRDWLAHHYVVIVDRYVYSNIAYQCAKFEEREKQKELREWILQMEFDYFNLPKPNINLFLDVPLTFVEQKLKEFRQGADRAYLNGKSDIHESSLIFQEKVRKVYLEQASLDPCFEVITCGDKTGSMCSQEEIFALIRAKMSSLFT